MKKAIKTTTSTVFWRKNGRNYTLVDDKGNPLRALPELDKAVFQALSGEKDIPYKEKNQIIRIWRPGKFTVESVTAPIWKEDQKKPSREMYTGMVLTKETIQEAEKYKEYLVSRYEKNQRKKVKQQFEQAFDKFFSDQTADNVSIFWIPDRHHEFRRWEELLNVDKYICFMNSEVERKGGEIHLWDSEWGVILRRDTVEKVQQSQGKILYLKAPEEVMTKIRDAKFIGAMKHNLGMNFIKVSPV